MEGLVLSRPIKLRLSVNELLTTSFHSRRVFFLPRTFSRPSKRSVRRVILRCSLPDRPTPFTRPWVWVLGPLHPWTSHALSETTGALSFPSRPRLFVPQSLTPTLPRLRLLKHLSLVEQDFLYCRSLSSSYGQSGYRPLWEGSPHPNTLDAPDFMRVISRVSKL